MRSRTIRGTLAFLTLVLASTGCTKDEDDGDTSDDGNDDTGSYWYVGKDGVMFRVDPDGAAPSTYALESDADLLAIACRGEDEAWVVGERGAILSTFDGGSSWATITAETDDDENLVAVAVDHDRAVWIAGEAGSLLHSADAGESWSYLPSGDHAWTGLATDAHGDHALLTDSAGTVWSHDGETLTALFSASEPLDDVWMTPNGGVAVAVGERGTMVESRDGGASWTQLSVDTARDLKAVFVSGDGESIFAVGEAGVVVRIDERGVAVDELLSPELNLRDLHMSADHAGHVVGDAGTALLSWDLGESWEPIELDTQAELTGLDQLHGEPHL
jgi:photosystem II stability/assembly factor-like uncharacterized protein